MKKLFASVLTLALAASTGTAAFAGSETNKGTDTTINVKGTYNGSSTDVISVDIAWDEMSFTYTASGSTWNPSTHETVDVGGSWAPTGDTDPKITVTNHSNTSVSAAFAFNTEVSGLSGSFTDTNDKTITSLTIDSAVDTTPSNAPKAEVSFSISGDGITQDYNELGTITVKIAKAGAVKIVSNETELHDALSSSDTANVKLDADITLYKQLPDIDCVIDLNHYTLSALNGRETVRQGYRKMTIKNGIIKNDQDIVVFADYNSEITLENCEITSSRFAPLCLIGATATLKDCTINHYYSSYSTIQIENGYGKDSSLIFSGNTIINSSSSPVFELDEGSTITCLAGTYNFDPTAYVDLNTYNVTDDGNGTWTVTAN